MKKSYLVEGYRFVVAISIIVYHTFNIWEMATSLRLGVEFFFVLSGFLLMGHLEKHPDESIPRLMMGKLAHVYPYIVMSFIASSVAVSIIKDQNIAHLMYQQSHELLLLTNAFKGIKGITWMNGSGQLWFLVTQLWATLILSWLIKNYENAYRSIGAVLLAVGGYVAIIRGTGVLSVEIYWTLGENKIFMPFLLLRALSGMACGTLVYMSYTKLQKYTFTDFAKAGGGLSILCMGTALWLSARTKEQCFNAYSWRALLVVALYMAAILLAFTFAQGIPKGNRAKKVLAFLGRMSLPIYVSHSLVLYIMRHTIEMPYFRRRWLLVAFAGTAVVSVLLELCVQLLRKGWAAFMVWLKKMCIAEPIE